MKIYLLTKNPGKIKAAKSVFEKYGIEVGNVEAKCPEIQADTSLEVARYAAKLASEDTGLPVVREDHSLFINALGFPGPYTSFIEKQTPPERLLQLLSLDQDRSGHFELALAYVDSKNNVSKDFVYRVPIHFKTEEVVADPRGGWNGLICLEGETKAFTEYPEEERVGVWNKNYLRLAELFSSQRS